MKMLKTKKYIGVFSGSSILNIFADIYGVGFISNPPITNVFGDNDHGNISNPPIGD